MTLKADSTEDFLSKYLGRIAIAVVLLGVAIVRWRFGWPSVALWLAFCALSGAAMLFWESLRSALDPSAPGDGDDDPDVRMRAQSELEERKKAALRAVKDLQFEFEIGRLSAQDHKELSDRYRQEARTVMVELDAALGTHLQEAEREFDRIAASFKTEAVFRKPGDERTVEVPSVDEKKVTENPAVETSLSSGLLSIPSSDPSSDASSCPKCATRNDVDAKFCKNCATALGASEKSQ